MNQLNKFKKAAPLLLLTAMSPAMATDLLVPLNFTTLPVISIATITALDFGPVLSLTLADTCTMSTSAGTDLTPTQEGADSTDALVFTGGTAIAQPVGAFTGDCLGAADGTPGIYEITSFVDALITVTVTAGTATDISFAPAGYVTDLDESGGFSREALSIGVDAGAEASAAISAYAQAGTNRAVIGGTITNFAPLVAGDPYATDFNLDVVYQ